MPRVIRKFTVEEYEFLQTNYTSMSHEEMAKVLGRTRNSIRSRCHLLRLTKKETKWTNDEHEFLIGVYKTRGYVDVAAVSKKMGRSIDAIQIKAGRLGLGFKTRPRVKERKIRINKFATPEERNKNQSELTIKRLKERGHPRGSLGMRHTEKTKAILSIKSKERWEKKSDSERDEMIFKAALSREKNGTKQNMNRANATWGSGWREIGGIRKYYRSKWEANYARYLQWLKEHGEIESWLHEPETFWFEGIKRGCLSYLPDFRVVEKNGSIVFHEVKGWMDDRSKTKIKRMAKYHPQAKLIVIDSKGYNSIKKVMQSIILDWEVDAKGR